MAGRNAAKDAARRGGAGANRFGRGSWVRQVLLVARRARTRGGAGPAGGRQLRQRLQRRDTRLGRAAGRAGPAGPRRACGAAAGRGWGPSGGAAGGVAPRGQVRSPAFGCFLRAGAAGLALAAVTSWWLVAV